MNLSSMNLFMDVGDCWGMDVKELQSKRRNIYLGISINNRYFDRWALGNLIDWGVKYTNQKFALLIVDTPQAYNNMVFERISYENALSKALSKADEIEKTCLQLRKGLMPYERVKFLMLRWSDIASDKDYIHNLNIVTEEFEHNEQFADFVKGIVKKNLGKITNRLHSCEEINILSKYLLAEIPTLITGISYKARNSSISTKFNATIYPGNLGNVARVREMDFFKPAMEKMKLNGTLNGMLELYVK